MDWYADTEAPGVMSRLRHELVAYLRRHAADESGLDEAELVIAEVTGNAIRHTDGAAWVSLEWRGQQPQLTVRDLGPGFEPETLTEGTLGQDAPAADQPEPLLRESGRGLFLITALASELEVRAREGGGTAVSVTLPVRRRPSADHDPPRITSEALPDLSEAQLDGGFGKESFLRALVVQLARAVDREHGPDAADAAIAQVGTDVGGQMEAEFRRAEEITARLTPAQMGRCYVRLKHAIDGGFRVLEVDEHHIVLGNTRCPFGEVVQLAPSLCRMTSSVFGGIAARNSDGPVGVLLEERIALGDEGCRVVVVFDDAAEVDPDATHWYSPPLG